MNDVLKKNKTFVSKYKYFIIGGIIIVVLYVCSLWSDRKDLYDNGNTTNAIRNELDHAEGAKQDIAGTASSIEGTSSDIANTSKNIEGTINTATDASSNFESILNECQSIIDAIRKTN